MLRLLLFSLVLDYGANVGAELTYFLVETLMMIDAGMHGNVLLV